MLPGLHSSSCPGGSGLCRSGGTPSHEWRVPSSPGYLQVQAARRAASGVGTSGSLAGHVPALASEYGQPLFGGDALDTGGPVMELQGAAAPARAIRGCSMLQQAVEEEAAARWQWHRCCPSPRDVVIADLPVPAVEVDPWPFSVASG